MTATKINRMKPFCYNIFLICLMFEIASCSEPYQPEYAVCTSVSNYPLLKAAGYEYVESEVAYLMPDKSDVEFQVHLDEIKELKARIISCISFIPGSLPLVGPEAKQEEALAWADVALRRAGMINIPYIVFGSGKARNVPEGFSREEAMEQFISFCKQIAPLAEEYKVTVVIEALNRSETNLINSLGEGVRVVEAVNHPNVQLLCDIYHMLKEDEPSSEIVKYGKYIRHCHIAEKEERASPGTKGDDFRPYFKALKQIGYKGCMSIECGWKDFEKEIQPALSYIQEQFRSL
jgi:sugar phosphate isomerase/epimerase